LENFTDRPARKFFMRNSVASSFGSLSEYSKWNPFPESDRIGSGNPKLPRNRREKG
jgi:hypothetical protein